MTLPLDDDPIGQGVIDQRERGVIREMVGLLSVLVGLIVLGAVLASVDTRWAIGLGAVVLIAGGLWLGNRPTVEGD